ncbi:hypothetical protein M422DRAFT_248907 [Sphaerobolus stellatus SS14]|nr:hypothetical protein M422DRAFT_248907 [Sphaerobolus stellatus SS14]
MPEQRSHMFPLYAKPGGHRKLTKIRLYWVMITEMEAYYAQCKADESKLKELKLAIATPIENLTYNPYQIRSAAGVLFLIDRGPLVAVKQVLDILNPDLRDYTFFTQRRSTTLNNQPVHPKYFCQVDEIGRMSNVKCIVVPLAPWQFTPDDIRDFVRETQAWKDGTTSVNGRKNDPPWVNADIMWAYLHDLCLAHECHHFVITTYSRWIFGGFSDHYAIGYTTYGLVAEGLSSPGKPSLSVLQNLVFWIQKACRAPGSRPFPKVGDEKLYFSYEHEVACSVGDIFEAMPDIVIAVANAK